MYKVKYHKMPIDGNISYGMDTCYTDIPIEKIKQAIDYSDIMPKGYESKIISIEDILGYIITSESLLGD